MYVYDTLIVVLVIVDIVIYSLINDEVPEATRLAKTVNVEELIKAIPKHSKVADDCS